MNTAADWIDQNADYHDRFLMFVDEFDPHEPFDTPAPWVNRYDESWDGEQLIWPPYGVRAVERGMITQREGRHIRCNYGSKLSMIDHWFGRVLDAIDRQALWDNTMVVVCTDHGHYLGEKDIWGKPAVPQYEALGHTPLYIAHPGIEAGHVDALTTNVDLHATLCDLFGVSATHQTHGISLLPLLRGETHSVRDWALGGVFGNWVQICDGRRKYARAPVGDNFPLSLWSNRWSTMPVHRAEVPWPMPDNRAVLDFMPGATIPVIRQSFQPGDLVPYWCARPRADEHHLYDIDLDPLESENRLAGQDERDMIELLRLALTEISAPADQLERLGLS